MKRILLLFFVFFAFISISQAEPGSVSARLPVTKAWIGQRLSFFIELRAPGSFVGAASFDMPQVPGTIIIKIGAPVVSSEERGEQSWFIQSHEFALFSQKTGVLKIPQFQVRFASRIGFSGPASDVKAIFPGMEVDIQRPPGSEDIDFLITTDSLLISETWAPQPGPAEAGAIFKRTIVQQASEISGIALAPPSVVTSNGINVYTADAVIKDTVERGDFKGERSDTITYQLTQPGNFTLPELSYVWWNPKTKKLESKTLPAVNFQITQPPGSLSSQTLAANRFLWIGLLVVVCIVGVGIWQKDRLALWEHQILQFLNPPERVAARKILHACSHNDARGALVAWNVWRNTQKSETQFNAELLLAMLLLERHLFGPQNDSDWQGDSLARALEMQLIDMKEKKLNRAASVLPELN